VLEPGEGMGHEAKENKSGVAVATSRGRDEGIVARAEPGEASVQVTAAVNAKEHRSSVAVAPSPRRPVAPSPRRHAGSGPKAKLGDHPGD
jgi:hypothetical protein